jgi:hypothetical protein
MSRQRRVGRASAARCWLGSRTAVRRRRAQPAGMDVLNWNAPSIAFYDSLGAASKSEWTIRPQRRRFSKTGGGLRSLDTRDTPGDADFPTSGMRLSFASGSTRAHVRSSSSPWLLGLSALLIPQLDRRIDCGMRDHPHANGFMC